MNTHTSLIKVSSILAASLVAVALSVSFAYATISSITNVAPTGTIESGDVTITWNAVGEAGDEVDIYYSTNDFSVETRLTTAGLSYDAGTYTWDTVAAGIPDSTNYKVKVKSTANDTNGISASTFTIDNTPPEFITPVSDGVEAGPVKKDTINVSVTDATSGIDAGTLKYGFSSTDDACDTADYVSGDAGTYSSGVNFDIEGNHQDYLCVQATDIAGNTAYLQVGKLNTDNDPPTIDAADIIGTTVQGGNDTVEITFSEDVIAEDGTWSANEFTSITSGGSALDLTGASFSYNSPTLTITLDETNEWLKNDDTIDVTPATDAIKDFAGGNSLAATVVTGTTANTGDTDEPTVAITYTNDGPVKDTDTLTITATFNEALDLTAAPNAPTISVDLDGAVTDTAMTATGDPLVWTYDWTVATASADGDATITIGAEDLAGNDDPQESNNTIEVDNTAPSVMTDGLYTLDDAAAHAYFNPTSDDVEIDITANEPVKYTRIYICEEGDATCGTSTAKKWFSQSGYDTDVTKDWDGKDSTSTQVPDGEYKLKVNIEDEAGNTATEFLTPHNMFVDSANPTLTDPLADPQADTVYRTDPPLAFTPSDTGSGALTCEYSIDGGTGTAVACTSSTPVSTTIPGLSDGRHEVSVTVTDAAGNSVTSGITSFVFDNDDILTVGTIPAQDFDVIQDAVDAALAGHRVEVQSGTYAESVLIEKALTVVGVDATRPVITGDDSTDNYIVKVDGADGVTLDNLEVNGGGTAPGDNAFDYGILVTDSGTSVSPTTISNSIVTNVWKTSGNGIDINTGSYALVHDNSVSSFHKRGIRFMDSEGKFYDNTVIGDNVDGTSRVQNLVNLWSGSNVEIYGNDLDGGMSGAGATWSSPAILVTAYNGSGAGSPSTADIHDNEIHDGDVGVNVGSIYAPGDTSHVIVTGNNIHDMEVGIVFENDTVTASIMHNQIVDTDTGASSPSWAVAPHPSYVAEKNWWGSTSGPYNATHNPLGTGSDADDQVDFSPFCVTVPVYDGGTDTWSCDLASVDPVASFALSFSPATQTVGTNADLIATAKDAAGYTVVNDTSTNVSFDVVSGVATLGDLTLVMEADGDVTTTITSTVAGTVGVKAEDQGNPSAFGTGTMSFTNSDVTGPNVTAQWPTDGSTGVSVSAVPYLEFDEPLKSSTVNSTNIQLRKYSDDSQVSATVALVEGDTKVTITPNSPLAYETQYYLYASSAVTDPTGNALQTDYDDSEKASHEFTTAADSSDTTAPTLNSHTPADDATDISVTVRPTITFSEALAAGTVNSTNIQLKKYSDDSAVSAVVSLVEGGATVLITPDSNLENGTQYYLVVSASVTDEAGNPLSNPIGTSEKDSHEFTTATVEPIVVDRIETISNSATADDTYLNGWHYVYHITVNTTETDLFVKFADWVRSGGAETVAANGNMRALFNSSTGDGMGSVVGLTESDIEDGFGTVQSFEIGNDYTDQKLSGTATAIDISGKDVSTEDGVQVKFDVFTKLPAGTTAGLYETTYGIIVEEAAQPGSN